MKNVHLFLGTEKLLIKNKIDKLIAESKVNEYNITSYDMETDNVGMAISDAMTLPFLGNQKVIIIKNPIFLGKIKSLINHNTEMLINYIKNPNNSTILIIDASTIELDEKNELLIALRKFSEVSETKELSEVEMHGWLKRQCGLAGGVEIEEDAVNLFFKMVGSNLINAKGELDKLLNYIGVRKVITINDVSKLVFKELETDVFALTNAIVKKNKVEMIRIYKELLKTGNDPMKLLGLISKNMRDSYTILLMLENNYKQADIASTLGISSGRAYYMIKNARSFKKQILENIILKLAEFDYNIKIGKTNKDLALEMFFYNI